MSDLTIKLNIQISRVLFYQACVDDPSDRTTFYDNFNEYCNYLTEQCKKRYSGVFTEVSWSYNDDLSVNIHFSVDANLRADKEAYMETMLLEQYTDKTLFLEFWKWHKKYIEFKGVLSE